MNFLLSLHRNYEDNTTSLALRANVYLSNGNSSFSPRNIPGVNSNYETARAHLKASLSLTYKKIFQRYARMLVQLIKLELTNKKHAVLKNNSQIYTYRIIEWSNKHRIKAVTRGSNFGLEGIALALDRETRSGSGRKTEWEVVESISLKLILLN